MYNIYVEEKKNKKFENEEKERKKLFKYKEKFKSKKKSQIFFNNSFP